MPKTYQAIMVSSTFTDLKEHRQQVIEAIQHHGFRANVMKYSGAAFGPDVLGKSLAMVAESAAYILIIGHRYGQTPFDSARNAAALSITELEFDEAIPLGRPVLLFVIADDHVVIKGGWETDPAKTAKLEAFIARAKLIDPNDQDNQIERVWETFASAENLGKRAAIAVGKMALELAAHSNIPPEIQSATQRALETALADEAHKRAISEEAFIALAAKVAGNVEDVETAKRELERAIDQFIEIRDRAAQGSNFGHLIDETMHRIAALNEQGRFADGAREAERAFNDLQTRKEEINSSELRAIQAAIDQHKLALDAPAVARWIEQRLKAKTGTVNANDLFAQLKTLRDLALTRGLWFEGETALALARRAVQLATPGGETGAAQNWLGLVASDSGERLGGVEGAAKLEEAVTAYRAALRVRTEAELPAEWAMAQNNLGIALASQGERLGGVEGATKLEEAVIAYRAALRIYTEAIWPAQWATTQNNLGDALRVQGARLGGTRGAAKLEEAVKVFRAALRVYTEAAIPAEWAMTQNNLGIALKAQANHLVGAKGTAKLEEAVTAYRAALRVYTEAALPADWAMTQNNLGAALQTQGERLGGPEGAARLGEAVTVLRCALRVRTEEELPAAWAMTQNNLGAALKAQGEQIGGAIGAVKLDEAIAAFRAALRIYTSAELPAHWAATQTNLGGALKTQGEYLGGAEGAAKLDEAIKAHCAALEVRTEAELPADWAMTRENMALTFESLANCRPDRAGVYLREAEAAVLHALRVYTPTDMPYGHSTATELLFRIRARRATLGA